LAVAKCLLCGMYQAFWGVLWKAHHTDYEHEEDVHDLGNRFMLHFYQMLTQRLAIGDSPLAAELDKHLDKKWLEGESKWDDDCHDVVDRLNL
jgi:hypothetical protein